MSRYLYLVLKQEIAFEFGRIAKEPTYYQYHCEFRHDCLQYTDNLVNYWENTGFKIDDIENIEDIDLWVMFYCDKYDITMNDEYVEEFTKRKNEIDFI